MTTSLDLILLPLHRQNDRDLPELPGLHAAGAPRRAARGRSMDRLVLHLTLEGNAPLSSKGYDKLADHLTGIFYKTPGSSTTAMRGVSEWLNDYLLERNVRGASRSMQSIGLLTMAVIRGNRLFLTQCGPTHAFLIKTGSLERYYEPDLTDRGLGLGKVAKTRFFQQTLSPGDLLLISANPPTTWTPELLNSLHGTTLERMHLHLIHHVGPDLGAALVQVEAGSGKVKVLRPELKISDPKPQPVSVPAQETESNENRMASLELAPPPVVVSQPDVNLPLEAPHREPEEKPQPPLILDSPQTATPLPVAQVVEQPEIPEPVKAKPPKERIVGPALVKIGQAVGEMVRQATHATRELIRRTLPDESLLSIPTSVMAFIAIAVPIVVVAIAATVYFQRGQVSMFEENYLQASYAADQASQQTDPARQREAWNLVLSHLDVAETYQITDESQDMRNYAQTVLDHLDGVVRLPFQPALVGSLPGGASIKRIGTSVGDNELYLLNESDGHVIRATRTEQGYVIDPDFYCRPVPSPLIVSKLVDIVPLPLGDPNNAAVMGMDANGNLMQCIPGGNSPMTLQMPPPDMNWGKPSAFEMNDVGLYVLDPLTNAVWIFWLNDDFSERPTLFFDDQIPPMSDVIDLTLNRDDLFLLHADGHLTTCNFGFPTRCEDPALINDIREGGASRPTIDEALFREIQFSPPPDPSLYLLEPETPSIYHFSVRLSYQRQFRPQNPLVEGPATAFTITPNRQVFLAIEDQVYFAPLP